jgi:phosphoribosylformylglycinamidine synthase
MPRALILRTAGTNCDAELAHAFTLAGAAPVTVHLHQLIADPAILADFPLIGFPGGFSYGDDIAAGRIFANRLKHRLLEPLLEAIERGSAVIGICNGFQVLVKAGLLPTPNAQGTQTATLADNTSGRFTDHWVKLAVEPSNRCAWTAGLDQIELPIAHGEGRFTAPPEVLDQLESNGQVALRYAKEVNGSARAIAGVCDPTGRVFGLMPHPERFTHPTQHYGWTRQPEAFMTQTTPGLRIFQNAVAYAKSGATVGSHSL